MTILGDEFQSPNTENIVPLYTYCPFLNGIYSFTYTKTNHLNSQRNPELLATSNRPSQHLDIDIPMLACDETKSTSVISNCPKGHVINITFQKESCISNHYAQSERRSRMSKMHNILPDSMSFDCLGDWESETIGDRYVALLEKSSSLDGQPRYRCAVSSKFY